MSGDKHASPVLPGPVVQTASAWPMYRALVGIGLLCGLLIVTVYQLTLPVIAKNRAEALQRAIFQVLPNARSYRAFAPAPEAGARFREVTADAPGANAPSGPLFHAGYDDRGQLIGLAIAAQGMGYQDVIRVLYGYSFADQAIVGLQVLDSRETPGLGDKIEKDTAFLDNFERLDVALTPDGSAILHPIEAVKSGEKVSPWQVDTITGATISSVAIADILRQSTVEWLPRLAKGRGDFEAPGSGRKADSHGHTGNTQ